MSILAAVSHGGLQHQRVKISHELLFEEILASRQPGQGLREELLPRDVRGQCLLEALDDTAHAHDVPGEAHFRLHHTPSLGETAGIARTK